MVQENKISALPRTLAEFQNWEPNDGFKYEWNDGELIKFTGMNKTQLYIFHVLNSLFIKKGYWELGTLVAEQDVELSEIQMRRPDIAFFTNEQVEKAREGNDEISEFAIEVISGNDNINKVEAKISEYYKAGVKVIWLIFPEEKMVHVYTSRRDMKICLENDICSAAPVLPEFEIGVDVLLG